MSLMTGKLWVVATPLGNPGDLSERARQVLSSVDGVLAEDTRRAGLLMARCGVETAPFTSFHDHNEEERLPQVLGWLAAGKNLALVSDAGTPLLSDPGYRLVRACREAGHTVSPVPGPSAPVAALSACGLPPLPYAFLGFLPRKTREAERVLAPYAELPLTLVFFERKDRLQATLAAALAVLGNREGMVAREMTKTFEEFLPFTLAQHGDIPADLLGEITVVLGPPLARGKSDLTEAARIADEEKQVGGKPKEVVKRIHQRLCGWTAKEVYEFVRERPDKP